MSTSRSASSSTTLRFLLTSNKKQYLMLYEKHEIKAKQLHLKSENDKIMRMSTRIKDQYYDSSFNNISCNSKVDTNQLKFGFEQNTKVFHLFQKKRVQDNALQCNYFLLAYQQAFEKAKQTLLTQLSKSNL
jgi:hypothetical protein